MDTILIQRWNEKVQQEDTVFVLGDFCFKSTKNKQHKGEGTLHSYTYYDKQLNGKKIYIKGNHDDDKSCKTCIRSIKIKLGGKYINLVHSPEHVSYDCDLNFISHVHNAWKFKRFYNEGKKPKDIINVGVDVNNFYPINIEQILKEYHSWLKLFKNEKNSKTK